MVFRKNFSDLKSAKLFARGKSAAITKRYDWDSLKGMITFYEVSYKVK